MKKNKLLIIGIILAAAAIIGIFGGAGSEDAESIILGGMLLFSTGIVLIVIGIIKQKKSPAPTESAPSSNIKYDIPYEFKVAGVTFKNGNKTRQGILRKIDFGDEPFEDVDYTLREYTYEGEPAVGVYANGEQIGNVPKNEVSKVRKILPRVKIIIGKVYGGGANEYGEPKSYGASITLYYIKNETQK